MLLNGVKKIVMEGYVDGGKRFAKKAKGNVQYHNNNKRWYIRHGSVWVMDNPEHVHVTKFFQTHVLMQYRKIDKVLKDQLNKTRDKELADFMKAKWRSFMVKAQTHNFFIKCIRNVQADLTMPADKQMMDSDTRYIATRDGVVLDRETLEPLSEAEVIQRGIMITKRMNAVYKPVASSRKIRESIDLVTGGDKDKARYLLLTYARCLFHETHDEKLTFLHGPTAGNGKSTFSGVMEHLFGDYATKLPKDVLQGRQARTPEYYLAQLEGKRLVTVDELSACDALNVARVTQLTGGDDIIARKAYKDPKVIKATWKLIGLCNNLPPYDGAVQAMNRRMDVIPFTVNFTAEQQDRRVVDLKENLISDEQEMAGLLNLLLEVLRDERKQGCPSPAPTSVTGATQAYIKENQVLKTWLTKEVERTTDATSCISVATLYEEYQKDTEFYDFLKLYKNKSKFRQEVERLLGVQAVKVRGRYQLQGLCFKVADEHDQDIVMIDDGDYYDLMSLEEEQEEKHVTMMIEDQSVDIQTESAMEEDVGVKQEVIEDEEKEATMTTLVKEEETKVDLSSDETQSDIVTSSKEKQKRKKEKQKRKKNKRKKNRGKR